MKPNDIEARSFRIIDREAGDHGFDPRRWQIVRRMIHTSADFDYQRTVRFHPAAVDAGIAAIRSGADVVTDTRMAQAGIRKDALARHGGRVHCLIDDPEVARAARQGDTTRARAAVDAALDLMAGGIFVVGNAPTALLRLIELADAGRAAPGPGGGPARGLCQRGRVQGGPGDPRRPLHYQRRAQGRVKRGRQRGQRLNRFMFAAFKIRMTRT